ncbi:unnamed protein product [Fusarium graminearum]|uniref:Uncharacterized protein n=1 Tax=Gibberella zeae TaxID=5518 RepID=A0A2H3FJR4_GIBZA|nr:hypothetical protein FGRA07_11789 [Fusarium graminearum]CAG2003797.1 unnamed protein product [Fusarium graminearum]
MIQEKLRDNPLPCRWAPHLVMATDDTCDATKCLSIPDRMKFISVYGKSIEHTIDILHHVYPKNNDEAGPIFRLRSYVAADQGAGYPLLNPTSIRERDENLSRALELNTLLNNARPPSISQPPPDSTEESFVVLFEQSS